MSCRKLREKAITANDTIYEFIALYSCIDVVNIVLFFKKVAYRDAFRILLRYQI